MFAIYGTSGLVYRGPLEDFRKVAPSLRTARIRALMVEADRDPLAAATEITDCHREAETAKAHRG